MAITSGATETLEISRIATETILVPIVGTSPLITRKFSQKAKTQMLEGMQGVKRPKQNRDTEVEYQASIYRHDDGGYGMPVIAFKSATCSGARLFDKSVTMIGLRQFLFFDAEWSKAEGQKLARIIGEPHMREDFVRLKMNGTDLRYRPEFTEWQTTLRVTYVASMITQSSVLSLIDSGGMSVGVGEWRPEKKGDFGTYQIDSTRDVKVL